VVDGVAQALTASRAKKIFVCNLVGEPGQTDGFDVSDYVSEIERFLQGNVKLDYVLYNTHRPRRELLARYAEEGRTWIPYNTLDLANRHYTAIGDNLVAEESPDHHTLIRHNAQRVAGALLQLAYNAEL
jgi:uncharacterized cofD-like protein